MWATKPAMMSIKVASVRALREMFTEDLQGLYDADEIKQDTAPQNSGFSVADIKTNEVETEAEKFENLVEIVENPEPKNKINLEDL